MKLADVSWRLKVPLAITLVIVVTEIVVTALLVTRATAEARRDLELSAQGLATLLARSLRDPLLRDDLWQAFEVVTTPVAARGQGNPLQAVVVLDAKQQVFVASEPRRFVVSTAAKDLPEPLARIAARSAAVPGFHFELGRGVEAPELAAAGQIVADDGSRLGTVILDFDGLIYAQRIRSAVVNVALLSVPGLLLLVPLGWYAGKRLAEPLAQVANALAHVDAQSPERALAMLPPASRDEVGQLAAQARRMLDGLTRKAALEREIMASDRLAAVGRVSAAIAHEINNPLGGMLNSIDTALRHGSPDPVTTKTLGLLGRGLQQIRATVGALLVEARLDSPQLNALDWDDMLLLIQPDIGQRGLKLLWQIEPSATASIPLPGHEVRQLALNLLLNATAAAQPTAREVASIELTVAQASGMLAIVVGNTGPALAAEHIARMFEPFINVDAQDGTARRGLGLWVCWQIVQRLHGKIDVASDQDWTRVSVTLPFSVALSRE